METESKVIVAWKKERGEKEKGERGEKEKGERGEKEKGEREKLDFRC